MPPVDTSVAPLGCLRFKALDIDTWQEHVIHMHPDSAIYQSEDFAAQARVEVQIGQRSLIATLNLMDSGLLEKHEVSPSASAVDLLMARLGDKVCIRHAPSLESLYALRARIYDGHLNAKQLQEIITDISHERYVDVHIAAFLSACASGRMTIKKTINLTQAMVDSDGRLQWDHVVVADKRCVGGLPDNRTSPIVVAICAAVGLLLPKTSSHAVISPAGTADMAETLTRVSLSAAKLRYVVGQVGASFAWSGASSLNPVNDILIQVGRALGVNSDAQLVASILSKKIAAGSTRVLIDVPVGPTAKVCSVEDLGRLEVLLKRVVQAFEVQALVVHIGGTQPVDRGIGPTLETRDVLTVLQRIPTTPFDLRERSLLLAGVLLGFYGTAIAGTGLVMTADLLDSGAAWRRFETICEVQGDLRIPGGAVFHHDVAVEQNGITTHIDSHHLARIAKFADAPMHQVTDIRMHVRLRDQMSVGQPLFTIHAQTSGKLEYSSAYALTHAMVGPSPAGVG